VILDSDDRLLPHTAQVLHHNGVISRIIFWRHRCELRQNAQPGVCGANIGVCVAGHSQGFDTLPYPNPPVGCTYQCGVAMDIDVLIPHVPVGNNIWIEAAGPVLQVRGTVNVVARTVDRTKARVQYGVMRGHVVGNKVVDEALVEGAQFFDVEGVVLHMSGCNVQRYDA
jgi:hypothetical protein